MNAMELIKNFASGGGFKEMLPMAKQRILQRMKTFYQEGKEKHGDTVKNVFIRIEPNTGKSCPFTRIGLILAVHNGKSSENSAIEFHPDKFDLIKLILNIDENATSPVQKALLKSVKGFEGINKELYPKINASMASDEFILAFPENGELKMYLCRYQINSYLGEKIREVQFESLFIKK